MAKAAEGGKGERPEYRCARQVSWLSIVGKELDPAMVTDRLGIKPYRAFRSGDTIRARSGRKTEFVARVGQWKARIRRRGNRWAVPDHLEYWCERLEGRPTTARWLRSKGFEVLLDVFIIADDVTLFEISPEQISRLQRLGVGFRLGVYPLSMATRASDDDGA